jgi:hypothetical protein
MYWSGCRWSLRRPAVEVTIELDRGVDQGQVREGLREVAKLLAGSAIWRSPIRPCAAIGG